MPFKRCKLPAGVCEAWKCRLGGKMMNKGRVVQVMGPVVDVKFENGQLPKFIML